MKKHIPELTVLFLQALMFYVYPLFALPVDPIAMVLMILLATFVLSLMLGVLSGNKGKYLYPVATSILFIPTIFIYYNESASVHALWYLVVSAVGLCLGALARIVFKKGTSK